jgi:hypothetical protein
MTEQQRQKVKRKIRTDTILAAVKWLCANHSHWKAIDLDAFKAELKNTVPVVIDKSKECQSKNSNVETTELFSCYFPDGNTDEHTGGFDTQEEFKQYVDNMQRQNYNVSLQIQFTKEFLNKQEGHEMVCCCSILTVWEA